MLDWFIYYVVLASVLPIAVGSATLTVWFLCLFYRFYYKLLKAVSYLDSNKNKNE
ncbi:hypothetical protein MNB_SV-13-985 [hydrothermal vent metagenome]|uniref:Uncharacterized protein n=1 Tax=hydrothermal vent metagenome TaxID=652676 RepID=A0A1W1C4V4_9ZZZZ